MRVLSPWIVSRPTIYAAPPSRKFKPRRVTAFLDHMTARTEEMLAAMHSRRPGTSQPGP